MSALAERPVGSAPASAEPERHDCAAAMAALSELSLANFAGAELDDVLRLITTRACEVLSIKRCAVYVREEGCEIFTGRVAHPRQEIEAVARRLKLGGPNDEITRELVLAKEPLVIRDARSDPRAARAAVRASKLRSLLGVPMVLAGEVIGLLMFDNAHELHPYTEVDLQIAKAIAAIAAGTIAHFRSEGHLREQLKTATRQNLLLRRTTTAEHRLSETLLRGGGLAAVIELVTELTAKPTALYDSRGHAVASSRPTGGDGSCAVRLLEDAGRDQRITERLRDAVAGSSISIGPLLDAGLHHRHLAAPVDVGGARWGWLVLMENPTRFTAFDEFLIRRAATHVAIELAGRQQLDASSADTRASFARQLLRGTERADDIRRHAEYLGITLEVPRVVAYVTTRDGADAGFAEPENFVGGVREHIGGEVLATREPEGIALLIDLPSGTDARAGINQVKAALVAACVPSEDSRRLIVGISGVCRAPRSLPGAYREAREVTRCIETFPAVSARTVLAVDELGPGRLFVTRGDTGALDRFADDMVGPLLAGGEGTDELLRTLEAFFDTGRSVRLSSERLGVHQNTVRYRLSRVHAITGLDVAANAEDQLSIQVALLVLRLQGHSALRPFEAEGCPAFRPGTAGHSDELTLAG